MSFKSPLAARQIHFPLQLICTSFLCPGSVYYYYLVVHGGFCNIRGPGGCTSGLGVGGRAVERETGRPCPDTEGAAA